MFECVCVSVVCLFGSQYDRLHIISDIYLCAGNIYIYIIIYIKNMYCDYNNYYLFFFYYYYYFKNSFETCNARHHDHSYYTHAPYIWQYYKFTTPSWGHVAMHFEYTDDSFVIGTRPSECRRVMSYNFLCFPIGREDLYRLLITVHANRRYDRCRLIWLHTSNIIWGCYEKRVDVWVRHFLSSYFLHISNLTI